MKILWTILACAMVFSAFAEAQASDRIALVIGNAKYEHIKKLANSVNDAEDIAAKLEKIGFKVTLLKNATQGEMEAAVLNFKRALMSKQHEVGLFYYAGHGMDVGGKNYLLPKEIHIVGIADILTQGVSVDKLVGFMSSAGNQMNIVILDACRTVFEEGVALDLSRDASEGMATVTLPRAQKQSGGIIVVYSTLPGKKAQDGSGRNGIFTEKLLYQLETSGVEISTLVMSVRNKVIEATNGEQVPYENNTKRREFYFVPQSMSVPSEEKTEFKLIQVCCIDKQNKEKSTFEVEEEMRVKVRWEITRVPGNRYEKLTVDCDGVQAFQKELSKPASKGNWKYDCSVNEKTQKPGRYNLKVTLQIGNESLGHTIVVQRKAKPLPTPLETYSLPVEVWNACKYSQNGKDILDMTTDYWCNLSVPEQQKYAKAYQKGYAAQKHYDVEKIFPAKGANIVMRLIPPGRFWMGSTAEQIAKMKDFTTNGQRLDIGIRHRVVISKAFYIGKYEVTQRQWKAIMENSPSSFKNAGMEAPVDAVSWTACIRLARKIEMELPTEAQWEYACRAGVYGMTYIGDFDANSPKLNKIAWYIENSTVRYEGSRHGGLGVLPVGKKEPNEWGIYDTIGNLWEWCADQADWDEKLNKVITDTYVDKVDPLCTKGSKHIVRGGSWDNYAVICQSAARYCEPDSGNEWNGFRLVWSSYGDFDTRNHEEVVKEEDKPFEEEMPKKEKKIPEKSGISPKLTLMKDEYLQESKKTFSFFVGTSDSTVEIFFCVQFYVSEISGKDRGGKVSGYLEVDNKRIYTWKKEGIVTPIIAEVNKGRHSVTLGVTDSDRAYIAIFYINCHKGAIDELREITEPVK